ncbi:29021_t:CDS:2 [Gigaspora margarita]|uniref:29021_t:CDS:1 n=1 Tax=Gigaspora margarita TaxID=4874 RepID=A0ABN7V6N5_GIGMA|nr:29021_t:CDS:2 [Gigaspora margarita]
MNTITQSIRQDVKGKVNDSNIISSIAVSSLISSSVITSKQPIPEITEQLSNTNQEPQLVLLDKQIGSLRGSYIRSYLTNQSFSEKAIKLYEAAFDANSTKTVSSNIKKQMDPVAGSLNSIVKFFNNQLDSEKVYNTIAGYRSAISEIHDWINHLPIGFYPIIVKAMRGIYHKNPLPLPNDEIINLVLAFDKVRLLEDNNTIDILWLLQKFAFLLAIMIASRPFNLTRIKVISKLLTSNSAIFTIRNPKEHKISIAHSSNKSVTKRIYIGSYPDLPEILPLAIVDALLICTHAWYCKDEQKASLLLTSTGLHNPPFPDTVTR